MAGEVMLAGWFYIWVLAYKASYGLPCIACHFNTVELCSLETDAWENGDVFLQEKSPEKAVMFVMVFVQSRKSTAIQTWEEGDADIRSFSTQ